VIWVVFIVVALAVLGLFAALLAGRIDYDPLSDPTASQPASGLPDEPYAEDITGVRFDTALRGYRMDQVDDVLDRLQQRLEEREAELADRDRELHLLRGLGTRHDVGSEPSREPGRGLSREPSLEPSPEPSREPGVEPGGLSDSAPDSSARSDPDFGVHPGSESGAYPGPESGAHSGPDSGSGRTAVRGPQR
jgi:DivIVA domain-containing protein